MARKRRKIVVANWKMRPKTLTAARKLFAAIARRAAGVRGAETVVCPPAVFLGAFAEKYGGRAVHFGAQDCSREAGEGAFTGELSAGMLASAGAEYCILGHSERRARGDTDEVVAQKIQHVLAAGLSPVLCVGEAARDETGGYLATLEAQTLASLAGVGRAHARHLLLAYEPLWAIGKHAEDAAAPDDIRRMSLFLKKILVKKFGRNTAEAIPILYGGSVEAGNDDVLFGSGAIDGFLVGHASLDPDAFCEIIRAA